MSKSIKIIVAGAIIASAMLLFPPYDKNGWLHYPLFSPPTYKSSYNLAYRYDINWQILWVQLAVVTILTSIGAVASKPST